MLLQSQKFAHIEDIQRRIFASMLANLDDSVGAVMSKLRKEDLEKDTIVYFISDNGGPTRELTSSNLPLRGGKGQMYEGGIRVPFMVQWPGKIPGGKTYDRPVVTCDIFSTTFAAAQIPMPKNRKLDSVNILPYIKGEKNGNPHDTLYWRQGNKRALRKGDMKIVSSKKGKSEWELYDLSKDIAEKNNLAKKQPTTLEKLVKEWNKLDGEMVDAVFK